MTDIFESRQIHSILGYFYPGSKLVLNNFLQRCAFHLAGACFFLIVQCSSLIVLLDDLLIACVMCAAQTW